MTKRYRYSFVTFTRNEVRRTPLVFIREEIPSFISEILGMVFWDNYILRRVLTIVRAGVAKIP